MDSMRYAGCVCHFLQDLFIVSQESRVGSGWTILQSLMRNPDSFHIRLGSEHSSRACNDKTYDKRKCCTQWPTTVQHPGTICWVTWVVECFDWQLGEWQDEACYLINVIKRRLLNLSASDDDISVGSKWMSKYNIIIRLKW